MKPDRSVKDIKKAFEQQAKVDITPPVTTARLEVLVRFVFII
jgi:hypothetical protein